MESYVHCYNKSEDYITHTIKGNDIQQDLYSSAGVIHVSVYICIVCAKKCLYCSCLFVACNSNVAHQKRNMHKI